MTSCVSPQPQAEYLTIGNRSRVNQETDNKGVPAFPFSSRLSLNRWFHGFCLKKSSSKNHLMHVDRELQRGAVHIAILPCGIAVQFCVCGISANFHEDLKNIWKQASLISYRAYRERTRQCFSHSTEVQTEEEDSRKLGFRIKFYPS